MKRCLLLICCLALYTVPVFAQTYVEIKTDKGTMKVLLYEDTPNHKHVFTTRIKQGLFNGTLFTRIIPGFMIQGGSPDSKNAPTGARIGYSDRKAEIFPEFNEKYFHKKGAFVAPRQDSSINPD